jgi:hypothetical protein
MAQPYLSQLQAMVVDAVGDDIELVCKHFFSGAALYASGRMCASLSPSGLAFKLPGLRCRDLIESGAALPLCQSGNVPAKNGYALFPEPDDMDTQALAANFRECIDHARCQR